MVEEEEEPDIDEETGQYDHENDVNDVILNIVEGSDPDEEDELEHVIPCLETVTRHGRIAGTWQRHFKVDSDSGDDDSNEIYDGSENNSPAGRTESESESEPEPAPEPPATRGRTRTIKRPGFLFAPHLSRSLKSPPVCLGLQFR